MTCDDLDSRQGCCSEAPHSERPQLWREESLSKQTWPVLPPDKVVLSEFQSIGRTWQRFPLCPSPKENSSPQPTKVLSSDGRYNGNPDLGCSEEGNSNQLNYYSLAMRWPWGQGPLRVDSAAVCSSVVHAGLPCTVLWSGPFCASPLWPALVYSTLLL